MPIGDTARSVMWDYMQEREALMPRTKALWVSEQGEVLMPNGICQILKRLARRADIEDMHPHRFRHSYAINALRAGMPEQGPQNSGRMEEDSRDLLPDIGGGGRQGVSPAGQSGGPAGKGAFGPKRATAGPAEGKPVRILAHRAWQPSKYRFTGSLSLHLNVRRLTTIRSGQRGGDGGRPCLTNSFRSGAGGIQV